MPDPVAPRPLRFPDPAPGFARGQERAAGPWRAWCETRPIDPGLHVPRREVRVLRARGEGGPPERLAGHELSGSLALLLASEGTALVVPDRRAGLARLHPAEGPPRGLGLADELLFEPLGVWPDGAAGLTWSPAGSDPTRLVFLPAHGPARELDRGPRAQLQDPQLVRGGARLAWLRLRSDGGRELVTCALDRPGAARALPWELPPVPETAAPGALTLHGIAGPWLFAHRGELALLRHLDDARQHAVPAPGQVECPHPGAVLCRVPRGWSGTPATALLAWDPLGGDRWEVRTGRAGSIPRLGWAASGEALQAAGPDGLCELPLPPPAAWRAPAATAALHGALRATGPGTPEREAVYLGLAAHGGQADGLALVEGPLQSEALVRPTDVERVAPLLARLGHPTAIPWLAARERLRFPHPTQTAGTRRAVSAALALLRDRPAALAAWREARGSMAPPSQGEEHA